MRNTLIDDGKTISVVRKLARDKNGNSLIALLKQQTLNEMGYQFDLCPGMYVKLSFDRATGIITIDKAEQK